MTAAHRQIRRADAFALQAAQVDASEVITTSFTFPASPHALHWNGVRPVFYDIEDGLLKDLGFTIENAQALEPIYHLPGVTQKIGF